jgi:hypothetical protein
MATKSNSKISFIGLVLLVVFFPVKIFFVYFSNCIMDVYTAMAAEIAALQPDNDDLRWGR